MSALSSKSGEWQTPPWLVEKCRAALGGYITLDAATDENNVKAMHTITAEDDALDGVGSWAMWCERGMALSDPTRTLFLNPPGEKTGKLIRRFWERWDAESANFYASVWVDFNLDHLRFIKRQPADCLIIPRKRMAFVDPLTGKERTGAQIGGFILFRGYYQLGGGPNGKPALFPEPDFLTMRGEP